MLTRHSIGQLFFRPLVVATVLSLNVLGDALRGTVDPRG